MLFTQTLEPRFEGKELNLTKGLVFGAGKIKEVGMRTLGKEVGIPAEVIFFPGITW